MESIKKYTNVLISHENKNEHLDIITNIHYQYISELKYKGIDTRKKIIIFKYGIQ